MPDNPSLGPDAGKIKDGHFAFRSLSGGKRVQIRATRLLPGIPPDSHGVPASEEFLPAQLNSATELTAEVRSQGPNTLKFNLEP